MKNIKRIAVVVLALIMCLSAVSINSFAADETFDATAKINIAFNNVGDEVYAVVTTDKACGGLKGTITYSDHLLFVEKQSRFVEEALANELYTIDEDNHTITFAVLSNRPHTTSGGSTQWAALCFKIRNSKELANLQKEIKFTLTDAEVCSVGGSSYTINSAAVSTNADEKEKTYQFDSLLNGLGAQYRPNRAAVGNVAAVRNGIRFGTSLIRTYARVEEEGLSLLRTLIDIPGEGDGKEYAIVVGHVVGFPEKMTDTDNSGTIEQGEMEAQLQAQIFRNADGKPYGYPLDDKKTVCIDALTAYTKAKQFLTFTCLVESKGIDDGTGGALTREVVARPYIIYRKGATGAYKIYHGDIMKTSIDKLTAVSGSLVDIGEEAGALN